MNTSEQEFYLKQESQLIEWWSSERFVNVERPYKATDVACLRPTFFNNNTLQNHLSKKLYKMLLQARDNQKFHHTFGVLDPIQATNLVKYLDTIYISGWQCSSTASTTNEPGPDFADYPYDTVPNKVDQIVKALQFHDRKQNQERSQFTDEQRNKISKVDYLCPIIADADAGFGGTTSIMKLTQLFIQNGAAGIHIEDQRAGFKKCGHMGGKVIVATSEMCSRLTAVRLQADIMGSDLVIVSRTDSLSAKLIDSNIDPIDHPWILGINDASQPQKLVTFPEAGEIQLKKINDPELLQKWQLNCRNMSLKEAQSFAQLNGFEFYFDWETPRTPEGFYRVKGDVYFSARRGREFLRYADMLWMETDLPDLKRAKLLSQEIKQYHPQKFLAYNLSPSFNWSTSGMSDEEISNFCQELGKIGFVWQFITLAGFHLNALASEKFAREFKKEYMISYVKRIQRKEKKHNVDQLLHQKWSGAGMIDQQVTLVSQNTEICAGTKESTENQFANKRC